MKNIVQIELTNHCNRRCNYCGNRMMKRPRGFADDQMIDRCIFLLNRLGQTSVGLNHYGESLLHQKLIKYISRFNASGITPYLYTNGDLLTDDLIDQLVEVRLDPLVISFHMELEKRLALWNKCKDRMPTLWQPDNPETLINLAGQIPVEFAPEGAAPLTDPARQCQFLTEQRGIVLWNGDVTVCCPDYEGYGVYANIYDDNILDATPVPFDLCRTCPGHPGAVNPI
jgi:hypothetical protein